MVPARGRHKRQFFNLNFGLLLFPPAFQPSSSFSYIYKIREYLLEVHVHVCNNCQLCDKNYETDLLNSCCDSKNAIHNFIILNVYTLVYMFVIRFGCCASFCFTVAKVVVFFAYIGVNSLFMGYKLCFWGQKSQYLPRI